MARTAATKSSARLQWTAAWFLVVAVTVTVVGGGISGVDAAPQLQPLSAPQFVAAADGRSYAAGFGYGGGVVHAAPAAVQVGKAERLYADALPALPAGAVHVGYAPSAVYKPDLSAYAAASFPLVEQLRRFDPVVRPVHTVVPRVTAVEPSVTVQKTYVDVPAYYPHEYRPPVLQQQQDPSPYYYQLLVDGK